jgi:hypothetical protein
VSGRGTGFPTGGQSEGSPSELRKSAVARARSFQGKLGPWQLLKLMLGSGKYTRAGLLGIGVLPQQA